MKVRKKPVVVDAVQLSWATWSEVCDFVTVPGFRGCYLDDAGNVLPDGAISLKMGAIIPTLEDANLAKHVATEGDWIIRGVAGEFYPCKPEIFLATYEPVFEEEAEPL